MNLNQVTLLSNDLPRMVEFYTTLGLVLIVDSIPRYARFECPDGESTFSLHHSDEQFELNPTWLYFECDQLNRTVQELLAKGLTFLEMPRDQDWLWREARLSDPDGNTIILYHAGDNRKNPPWRVNQH
jgi:catechol 2,3-dioxygenase-like lactoylglutathione lyase family enzyme